ncbi:FAD-binding oxidoreductase [Pelagibacterales bacterium]|jgi:glycine/D-amino acid oxidase-like deaminating enzyme|nr:FAD-binding oxidoreductase [Pelagibacterales bacterium]MDC1302675.1 FAD-binding oxidoreductase [Pelagibacterales bacterium]MDC3262996.1 FAD-binding oxidoreductase [Pelagibacterales bacterium]
MKQLYDKAIYDFNTPIKSYWEDVSHFDQSRFPKLVGDHSCDVCVIGGGFTGISTAYHIAKKYGGDVRLLEAGHFGFASSGRNAGFCCLPSTKLSINQLIKRYGMDETKKFFASQIEGVDLLASLIADNNIECEKIGTGNLDVVHHPSSIEELKEWGNDLQNHFGINTRWIPKEEFDEVGHQSTEQFGAVFTEAGFAMNPMAFLNGFANATVDAGAQLHSHSRVKKWERNGKHKLITEEGSLTCDKVVVATNGYTDESLHPSFANRMVPVLSNIIVTREMSEDEFKMQNYKTLNPICNSREILYYYRRMPSNRMLFGTRGDTFGDDKSALKMRSMMTKQFQGVFPNWNDIDVEYYWRGTVVMNRDLVPAFGSLENDKSVFFSYGYHANGNNSTVYCGKKLAEMIYESNSGETNISKVYQGLSPKIPFAFLRLWYLRIYLWYSRFTDKSKKEI